MKKLLILASSLFLSACALSKFPDFPESVQVQYSVLVRGEPVAESFEQTVINAEEIPVATQSVHCLKFSIVSKLPYLVKYEGQVELAKCNLIQGFELKDFQDVTNWAYDVSEWSKGRKKCFK